MLRIQEWLADRGFGQYPQDLYLKVTVERTALAPRLSPIARAVKIIGLVGIMVVLLIGMLASAGALAIILYLAWLFFFT